MAYTTTTAMILFKFTNDFLNHHILFLGLMFLDIPEAHDLDDTPNSQGPFHLYFFDLFMFSSLSSQKCGHSSIPLSSS